MLNPIDIAFPFRYDASDRVATTPYGPHIEQMIEQVLLTNPGERVNRPAFGCGLRRYVFAPAGKELLTATEASVAHELNRWLSDVIHVGAVDIAIEASTLTISITYSELRTGMSRIATYSIATDS